MSRKWQKYIDTPIVEVTSKWVESGKNTLKHTKANYFYHIYFLLRNFVIVYWFLCFYMLFSVFWKYSKNPLCIQWENYLFFHKKYFDLKIFKIHSLCSPMKLRVVSFFIENDKNSKNHHYSFWQNSKKWKNAKNKIFWDLQKWSLLKRKTRTAATATYGKVSENLWKGGWVRDFLGLGPLWAWTGY